MKKLISLLTLAMFLLPEYSFGQLKQQKTALVNHTDVLIFESGLGVPLKNGDTRYVLFLKEDGNESDILKAMSSNLTKLEDSVDKKGGINSLPSLIFDAAGPKIMVVVEYREGTHYIYFEKDDSSTDNKGKRVVRVKQE